MNIKHRPHLRRFSASLLTLLLVVGYGSTIATPALADPSAATQSFFGFSGGGGGSSSTPKSCDISAIKAKAAALEKQLAADNDTSQAKIKEIQDQISQLPEGSMDQYNQLQAEQQQVLDDNKAALADIKAQEDALQKQTQGPSDQCKTDLVNRTVADMQSMVGAMSGGSISVAMAKVDSVTAEIESLEPKLAASGVNATDMATIKKDVKNVKSDSATLHGFFTAMKAQASSFIAQAQADPPGMYDRLNAGKEALGGGLTSSASAAADNLVQAFTSLVTLFDKLSGTTEGQ